MRFWFLLLVGLTWLLSPSQIVAQVQLRAVLPNPVGSDANEWIAIENTSTATVSSGLNTLRDVFGSVKEYSLPAFEPLELKIITATQSGITLNNTKEVVELLSGGVLIESTPEMIAKDEGIVWLKLEEQWYLVPVEEFEERLFSGDWSTLPTVTEDITESNVTASSTKSVVASMPSSIEISNPGSTFHPELDTDDFTTDSKFDRRLPVFIQDSPTSLSEGVSWPTPPEPDFDSEIEVFLNWKRRALAGSLGLVSGGVFLLLSTLPPIDRLWRWWRDELML